MHGRQHDGCFFASPVLTGELLVNVRLNVNVNININVDH
jgi:hypothetical protein